MRYILFTLLCVGSLHAGLWDDMHLYKAKTSHDDIALKEYTAIVDKNDKIYYNIANIHYRDERYASAITSYMHIDDPSLQSSKLYSIANCYMKLGNSKKAIIFYKASLKIKDLEDVRYNLKLARAIKAQEDKAKKEQEKKESNATMKIRDGAYEIDLFKDGNESNMTNDNEDKNITNYKTDNRAKLYVKRDLAKIYISQKLDINRTYIYEKSTTLNKIEESKWDSIVKSQTEKTLLIPIVSDRDDNNREENDEKW